MLEGFRLFMMNNKMAFWCTVSVHASLDFRCQFSQIAINIRVKIAHSREVPQFPFAIIDYKRR